MRFLSKSEIRPRFEGRRVAIVGSGPGVLTNAPGLVDEHDVVVRVNNYRCSDPRTGFRCDVHYSFYGSSIKKSAEDLKRDGVKLCMCKCPDADDVIDSDWHRRNNMMNGVGWKWIYRNRAPWWFCDVMVPTVEEFLAGFNLLGGHVPTTGFAAILDVLSFSPRDVYLTGFDFFRSRKHNVSESWRPKNNDDPVGHVPERELQHVATWWDQFPIGGDDVVTRMVNACPAAAA